ncbi:MAG: glycogen synthase GlgA [Clostridia bacterium]
MNTQDVSKPVQRKVLFAASECAPFIKTGGLADVVGALPATLAGMGLDVRVVLPKYRAIPFAYTAKLRHECDFLVKLGWRNQYCGVESLRMAGVTYYFIDNEYYFGREYIYGNFCSDEAERFAFFCKAVLEMMPRLNFFPDIAHLNDWQCGMVAALHKLQYVKLQQYRNMKTVFTVHNLRYQGVFSRDFVDELLELGEATMAPECLEYFGSVNYMKAGLVYADAITTVSRTYAREIQTDAYGETLDGVLRARSGVLHGIMNGIDAEAYDPSTDAYLPAHYTCADMAGKAACKAALQDEMGLVEDADIPLISMVTRLTGQKGLDLVECAINDIMNMDVQMCVVGTGELRYEQLFSWASWRYPGRIAPRLVYDDRLAHRAYAGADMFLMPSLFEPCGLAQLIAMRYGTLPIVRETGGLADSVQPYNKYTDEGIGFTFANYNACDMINTIMIAAQLYSDKPSWQRMRARAMAKRFGWQDSAKEYIALYDGLCSRIG